MDYVNWFGKFLYVWSATLFDYGWNVARNLSIHLSPIDQYFSLFTVENSLSRCCYTTHIDCFSYTWWQKRICFFIEDAAGVFWNLFFVARVCRVWKQKRKKKRTMRGYTGNIFKKILGTVKRVELWYWRSWKKYNPSFRFYGCLWGLQVDDFTKRRIAKCAWPKNYRLIFLHSGFIFWSHLFRHFSLSNYCDFEIHFSYLYTAFTVIIDISNCLVFSFELF